MSTAKELEQSDIPEITTIALKIDEKTANQYRKIANILGTTHKSNGNTNYSLTAKVAMEELATILEIIGEIEIPHYLIGTSELVKLNYRLERLEMMISGSPEIN